MTADSPLLIEKKIQRLRERMRGTLDRTKLPQLRQELMAEIEKLKAVGGGPKTSDGSERS
jgi:hypothetical protein